VKVYVATSSTPEWRRQAQHAMTLLKLRGHAITFDWVTHLEVIGHRTPTVEELRHAAKLDVRAIDDADAVVALIPPLETLSEGTFFELGYARGKRKAVVIVTQEEEPVRRNLFLRFATGVVSDIHEMLEVVDILGYDLEATRGAS
jgi:nucleoside 2-deoxyribosyltransferase